MQEVISLFGIPYIQIIGFLIAVDVLCGIIAAIVKKEFVFGKLAMFMKGPVLAYVFGFVILELYGKAFPKSGNWILLIGFVLIVIALLGSIFRNLGKIGLPLPKILQ